MTVTEWIIAFSFAAAWAGGTLLNQSDRATENLRPPLSFFDFVLATLEGAVFVFLPVFFPIVGRRALHWPFILLTVAIVIGGFSLRFIRRKIPKY